MRTDREILTYVKRSLISTLKLGIIACEEMRFRSYEFSTTELEHQTERRLEELEIRFKCILSNVQRICECFELTIPVEEEEPKTMLFNKELKND